MRHVSITVLLTALVGSGAASADPIVFKDQNQREVKLDKPAERLVSIVIPMTSTVIAIDGSIKKLIGMNPTAKSAILEGILGKIFPELKDIASNVTSPAFVPNVEALTALGPDLVIQWGDRGNDIVAPLTNAGLTSMLIRYGTEELTREYMTMAAAAIGKPDRVHQMLQWRETVEKDIETKAATIPDAKKPSVLYVASGLTTVTASGTAGSYNNWYIGMVGGKNAADELRGTVPINKEQIAQWNPDVILLNAFEAKIDANWVYDDPVLSLTKAATNHRVYKMPLGGYRWDPPNQESPLAWMWLANLMHPDVYHYDLRAEMKKAYGTLYNYQLTDTDIDGILWLPQQASAAGYDRFKAN